VAGVFVKVHVRWLILDGENHIDVILGPGVADDSRCDTQASRPWRRHRHLPRTAHRPRSCISADPSNRHHGQASFAKACASCTLRGQCTRAAGGRTITITAYEHELAAARVRQAGPVRAADYRATRPKVEWKLAHLVRRRHGDRRLRLRGLAEVAADFSCRPRRSTWPGWACWACVGPHRTAGLPHDPPPQPPGRHAVRRPVAARVHPADTGISYPCSRQHAWPLPSTGPKSLRLLCRVKRR
jgi:Transposase DDE domain